MQKGVPRQYTDNGDGTITDNKTGLMWEKLDDNNIDPLHDQDTTFTWDDAFTFKIAQLNTGSGFAGHTDWRLPNVNELASLSRYGTNSPSVDAVFNTNCQPGCDVTTCSCTPLVNVWSSTTWLSQLTSAGQVYFADGDIVPRDKNVIFYVRAVRSAGLSSLPARPLVTVQTSCFNSVGDSITCSGSGQDGELQTGEPRQYTDNGDGTISDNKTGLMWEKLSDDGSIHDQDTTYTWPDAFAVKIAALNTGSFAGHNDWRLPNVNELGSLVSYGTLNPSIDGIFNVDCQPGRDVLSCSCTPLTAFWSSTTYLSDPARAWQANFDTAGIESEVKDDPLHPLLSVRAVRTAP